MQTRKSGHGLVRVLPDAIERGDGMDTSPVHKVRTGEEVEFAVGNKHIFLEARKIYYNIHGAAKSNREDHPGLRLEEIPQHEARREV